MERILQDKQHIPLDFHEADNSVFPAQLDSQTRSIRDTPSFFVHHRQSGYVSASSFALSAVSLVFCAVVYLLVSCFRIPRSRSFGGGGKPRALAVGGVDWSAACGGAGGDDGEGGEKGHGEGGRGEHDQRIRSGPEVRAKQRKEDQKALEEGWNFLQIPGSKIGGVRRALSQSANVGYLCGRLLHLLTAETAYQLVSLLARLAIVDAASLAFVPSELERSRKNAIGQHIRLVQDTLKNVAAPNDEARSDLMDLLNVLVFFERPASSRRLRAASYRGFIVTSTQIVGSSCSYVTSCLTRMKRSLGASSGSPPEEEVARGIRIIQAILEVRIQFVLGAKIQRSLLLDSQKLTGSIILPEVASEANVRFPPLMSQLTMLDNAVEREGGQRFVPGTAEDFEVETLDEDALGSSLEHGLLPSANWGSADGNSRERDMAEGQYGRTDMETLMQLAPHAYNSMMHLLSQLNAVNGSLLSLRGRVSPQMYLELVSPVAALATLELGVLDMCPQSAEPARQQAVQAFLDLLATSLDCFTVNFANSETVDRIQGLRGILRLIKPKTRGPLSITQEMLEKFAAQVDVGRSLMDSTLALLTSIEEEIRGDIESVGKAVTHYSPVLDTVLRVRAEQILKCYCARFSLIRAHRKLRLWVLFSEEQVEYNANRVNHPSREEMDAEIQSTFRMKGSAPSTSYVRAPGSAALPPPPTQQAPEVSAQRQSFPLWSSQEGRERPAVVPPQSHTLLAQQVLEHQNQQYMYPEGSGGGTVPQQQPPPASRTRLYNLQQNPPHTPLPRMSPGILNFPVGSQMGLWNPGTPQPLPLVLLPSPMFQQPLAAAEDAEYQHFAPVVPVASPFQAHFGNWLRMGAAYRRGGATPPVGLPGYAQQQAAAFLGSSSGNYGQRPLAADLQSMLRVSRLPTSQDEEETE